MFSSGEYSDYRVYGLTVAKKTFNPEALCNEYIELYPEQTEQYSFKEYEFLKFLEGKNLVETVPYMEWYMSSYGNISEMRIDAQGPMKFS